MDHTGNVLKHGFILRVRRLDWADRVLSHSRGRSGMKSENTLVGKDGALCRPHFIHPLRENVT